MIIDRGQGNGGSPVQIATGSYTGTGKYGSSNPTVLTFDFRPKLVGISQGHSFTNHGATLLPFDALSEKFQNIGISGDSNSTWSACAKRNAENGISLYNDSYPSYQFNDSGKVYYYFAIG